MICQVGRSDSGVQRRAGRDALTGPLIRSVLHGGRAAVKAPGEAARAAADAQCRTKEDARDCEINDVIEYTPPYPFLCADFPARRCGIRVAPS
ncbi:hypothetical protein MTO96_011853 [Rhipicephalus appendiculatus]